MSFSFREMRPDEWHEVLRVRRAVFVAEQGGPAADEPDGRDPECRHYVVLWGEAIAGAARLYSLHPEEARLGRICLLPAYRGQGVGARLMAYLLQEVQRLGYREVALDAQVPVIDFYQRLGFRAEGEEFLDAGIPHRRMRMALPDQPSASSQASHSS